MTFWALQNLLAGPQVDDGAEFRPSSLNAASFAVFLGPKGTQSGIHQDAMATAFTMTVLKGHKQFLVFPPSEVDLLCHDPGIVIAYKCCDLQRCFISHDIDKMNSETTRFNVSAFTPDFSEETGCASAAKAKAFAADLMPGDVVYVRRCSLPIAASLT